MELVTMSDATLPHGSALESGRPPRADVRDWIPIEDLHGCSMRTRDNDTVPDPRPTQESSGDSSDPAVSGGASPKSASRQYISEPEPMDLLLRKVVQATPEVPNSLEPGIAYQTTHAPAAPYGRSELDARVLVQPSTDPGARRFAGEDGAATRLEAETVEIPRRRFSQNGLAIMVFVGVVAVGAAVAFALALRQTSTRADGSVAASPVSATVAPVPTPSMTSSLPLKSAETAPAAPPTMAVSVTTSPPRGVSHLPPTPSPPPATTRPKPPPAATTTPPSSLINQAPL
jgi:hypothetical protein